MEGIPCSPALLPAVGSSLGRDELIIYYSLSGLSSSAVHDLLTLHGHVISERHVRRIRNQYGVSSQQQEAPLHSICSAIRHELDGSGSLLGYRSMWYRLRQAHQLSVRRNTVQMLLPLLDPEGCLERSQHRLHRRVYRSKGPNYIWHCDGNDNLKPHGITIHGCIDGYSRRIIWMRCCNSNNDPTIVARHYIDAIRHVQVVPRILCVDRGTENVNLAYIQPTLRHDHSDELAGMGSFRFGRSSSNQRIEAWWGFLRARLTDWWIPFFHDLKSLGHFDDSIPYQIDAVRFCFGPLIEREISQLVFEWNHHHIRESTNSETPGGIPEILYLLPERSGTTDYKCCVDEELLTYAEENFAATDFHLRRSEFTRYCEQVKADFSIATPSSWRQALQLFYLVIADIQSQQ